MGSRITSYYVCVFVSEHDCQPHAPHCYTKSNPLSIFQDLNWSNHVFLNSIPTHLLLLVLPLLFLINFDFFLTSYTWPIFHFISQTSSSPIKTHSLHKSCNTRFSKSHLSSIINGSSSFNQESTKVNFPNWYIKLQFPSLSYCNIVHCCNCFFAGFLLLLCH